MMEDHPTSRDGVAQRIGDDGRAGAREMREAARALRQCMEGNQAAGLELYDRCLATDVFASPVGMHARLIELSGDSDTAEALRTLAVRRGFDVAWQTHPGAGLSSEAVAAVYEGEFANGRVNPLMVDRYLRALTALGRTAEIEALFDVPRLLHRTVLGDAGRIERTLREAEAELPYSGRVQISYSMRSLDDLQSRGVPAFDALLEAVRGEMSAYLDRFARSDHPLAGFVPPEFSVEAWAMLSRADGHNVRHTHPRGWVTGVYYPAALPPGSAGGALRVGGWIDPPPPGWPDASIDPAPGLLVLMPSWYVHWTEPTRTDGVRLSIAVDAVRA